MATGDLPPSMRSGDVTSHDVTPHQVTVARQLRAGIFEGQADALAAPIEAWMAACKPFATFVQKNLSKIRKKVRMSRDAEESRNLYCELGTAYLLLREPKFVVAYEPYSKAEGRSADFAVTFRTNTKFHVEVTRLRRSQHEQQLDPQLDQPGDANSGGEDAIAFLLRYESRRLMDVVCDKVGQLAADTPNILWVWSESRILPALEVGQTMLDLKRRVEQRDAELFSRHSYEKPADFIRCYQRLSAIIVQSLHQPFSDTLPLWWQNNDAKYPLPAKLANSLRARLAAEHSLGHPPDQVGDQKL